MRLIDCTLRDGGNLNNWKFETEDVHKIVSLLDESGVDVIEIGYRGGSGSKRETGAGLTADYPTDKIRDLPALSHAALAVMVVPKVCPPSAIDDLVDSPVEWVRVAAYPNDIAQAFSFIEHVRRRGKRAGLNLMAVTYANTAEIGQIASSAVSAGAEMIYVADSFGAMNPITVTETVRAIGAKVSVDIGFHGHNNLGLAFMNARAAVEAGATCLDASLCGMARGAGNLSTEQVIASAAWFLPCHRADVRAALRASEFISDRYMSSPMPIRRPEIECGLGNMHYFGYGDICMASEKTGVDRITLMDTLSKTQVIRPSLERIDSLARSLAVEAWGHS